MMKRDMQDQGVTVAAKRTHPPEAEFDQWAKAVREQMVAALKRRGSV